MGYASPTGTRERVRVDHHLIASLEVAWLACSHAPIRVIPRYVPPVKVVDLGGPMGAAPIPELAPVAIPFQHDPPDTAPCPGTAARPPPAWVTHPRLRYSVDPPPLDLATPAHKPLATCLRSGWQSACLGGGPLTLHPANRSTARRARPRWVDRTARRSCTGPARRLLARRRPRGPSRSARHGWAAARIVPTWWRPSA
jgi:hypothetical protein